MLWHGVHYMEYIVFARPVFVNMAEPHDSLYATDIHRFICLSDYRSIPLVKIKSPIHCMYKTWYQTC